ncbi:MAG: hypothetical protein IPK78_18340, partial [Rhodospirillales bacterium]|nr:hypothetical protein [Rhodospirillales bacterium]
MSGTLIFTPTWLTDAGPAMRRETRASIQEQRLPSSLGAMEWVIGVENPFGPHDLRNVLHQYRNAWRAALEGRFDALVTVEHDIRLPDDGALKRLLATDAEVVFGVYMLRHGEPVLNTYRFEGDKNVGQSLTLHRRDLMAARRRATVRVSGVGWGCTLLRRSVLERMDLSDGGGENPAGDTAFAAACLQAKIPMLARWDVMCGHYDPQRGWLWPFKECATMVKVIGVQRVIMRGGFRVPPGVE